MRKQKQRSASGLQWLWLSVFVILIDRYSKWWVVKHLTYHEPFEIFSFLNFTLSYNTGAAFSFLDQASGWQNIFLGSLAVIVSIVILVWLKSLPANAYIKNMALSFILGGALGNACDRILHGYVIDFLSFHWHAWYYAIFNVADSAICFGAFLLFIHWVSKREI